VSKSTPTLRSQFKSEWPWPERLAELALACSGSFASEQARLLRDMRELLLAAPVPSMLTGTDMPGATAFEAMLATGSWTSAAFSLLGDECGYMLSRGSGGRHMVSIVLPGRTEESTASADSAALAIIAALATALQDAPMLPGDPGDPAFIPALRLN